MICGFDSFDFEKDRVSETTMVDLKVIVVFGEVFW